MPQSTDKKRINPRQKRARQTIDTIMEATAQVLERSGGGDFTTNHIVRRAGFSIGTLYRYFPHKKAILREMVESTLRQQDEQVREALAHSEGATGEEIIELAVHSMLEPFLNRSRVRVHMIRDKGADSGRRLCRVSERRTVADGAPISVEAGRN